MSEADYFHVPYPSNPLDLLPSRSSMDTSKDAVDPFDQLPQEVSDQIFSLLSISALDAARYVSRTWYQRIMTNGWVLRQVLNLDSHPPSDEEDSPSDEDDNQHAQDLRYLARELDIQSRLAGTGNSVEAWRVRYRRCDIAFSIPGHRECSGEDKEGGVFGARRCSRRIMLAGVSSSGSFVAFICVEVSGSRESRHSVLIYHIDTTGKPELVAPIACPQNNEIPIDVDLSEGEYAGTWLAGVTFSGQKKHLFISPQLRRSRISRIIALEEVSTSGYPVVPPSIRDVQRYCNTCCDYHPVSVSKDLNARTVLTLGSVEEDHTQDDWVCVEKCDCTGTWLLLENLPITVGGTERPYHLARHEQTGNLFIVQLEKCATDEASTRDATCESFQNLEEVKPLVLLVRPHHHTSYTNVSVSPQVMFRTSYLQQIVRIAVLWHEADYPATEKVGLYTYDVVSLRSMMFDEHGNRTGTEQNHPVWGGGWVMGTNGQWTSRVRSLAQAEPFDYTPTEYLPIDSDPRQMMKLKGRTSGRRVCGLERGMGGLHSSFLPPRNSSKQMADNTPLGSIKLLGDGRKKCMIWGPDASSAADHMNFVILEFGKTFRENEFWELSISESEISNGGVGKDHCSTRHFARHCACAYHDYGYRVTFPELKDTDPPLAVGSAAVGKSSFWPLPFTMAHSAAVRSGSLGQIVPYRRYGDVLAARKKQVEDRRRETLEGKEKAFAEIMGLMEQTRIQGDQVVLPNNFPPRKTCGWRWKGLLGSK
ncbi:hypothetical protein FGG08_000347 [Glutinoglossum americanum]|uniref:F-box domain-containing protein n=1 Tax=Glutinoglossum americanum TaxID=1670608 RepID=A0A9P8L6W1_9PEZI|nr:hypothetical protein FGG08_000347 [Glutinoglossum americanum]